VFLCQIDVMDSKDRKLF